MGFYFIKIAEDKGRQALRAAIAGECGKPLRLRQEAEQLTDSLPSNEAEATARFDGIAFNTQLPRN